MNRKTLTSSLRFSKTLASKLLLLAAAVSMAPLAQAGVITVEKQVRQPVRLGIDAERLWFWSPNNAQNLARVSVGELKVEYARVAMVPGYEREEGVINPNAYAKTLAMMKSFKAENPNIKFFATPQPLEEAYTEAEALRQFNRPKPPWAPYPLWINEFERNGTDAEGYTKWSFTKLNISKAARYLADYLNLMHRNGLSIDFLDITNEFNYITPADYQIILSRMKLRLDRGVRLPQIIAPSSGRFQAGTTWLNSVNTNLGQQNSFNIAGVHNTFDDGFAGAASFVAKARQMGKPVWSTEMHKWTGIALPDEVENSRFLWEHFRLGFVGIDTWLFFGPLAGKDHTMLWSNSGGTIVKSGKYEIFKRLANSVNGGKYVNTSALTGVTTSAAFLKGNVMQVWVLNNNETDAGAVTFQLNGRTITSSNVTKTVWRHADSDKNGTTSLMPKSNGTSFNQWVHPNALYCFEFRVADQ